MVIKIVIAVFVLIILINLYFRIKVLNNYKYLVKNEIDFNVLDIFNEKNIEAILNGQPQKHHDHIRAFSKYLKMGVYLTCSIIIVIALLFVWMKN